MAVELVGAVVTIVVSTMQVVVVVTITIISIVAITVLTITIPNTILCVMTITIPNTFLCIDIIITIIRNIIPNTILCASNITLNSCPVDRVPWLPVVQQPLEAGVRTCDCGSCHCRCGRTCDCRCCHGGMNRIVVTHLLEVYFGIGFESSKFLCGRFFPSLSMVQ